MTAYELLIALQVGFLLIGLTISVFYLRADYEVDFTRQQLFEIRDELFDYALDGGVAFANPAYTQLRDLINGLIRFAHRLTVWRLLATFALYSLWGLKAPSHFAQSLEQNICSIGSPEVRRSLKAIHQKAIAIVIRQLLRSSIVFWPLMAAVRLKDRFGASVRADAFRKASESAMVKKQVRWIEEQAVYCA